MTLTDVETHGARLRGVGLADLFTADQDRVARLTFTAPGLRVDFSKQLLDAAALEALMQLAHTSGVHGLRDKMLAGAVVNPTEQRPALHTALRGVGGTAETAAAVTSARQALRAFCAKVRDDTDIRAIVHIGIGGSVLGPKLLLEALAADARPGLEVRFCANVDGADITDALAGLTPAHTLVVVVSKTFTTLETMANAVVARDWLSTALGTTAANARLCAVTAAPTRAEAWGVSPDQVFPFWDWVGGRFSLWSAVGLSVEAALPAEGFDALLAGAAAMDQHFAGTPPARNLPLIAGLVQHWNRRVLGFGSTATIPYSHRLRSLPAFLQQLEMESNGKRVTVEGQTLNAPSAGVTWGAPGTDAQHSFFQLLHQGVTPIPTEILVLVNGHEGPTAHRTMLLANALAQAEALMAGKDEATARAELISQGMEPAAAAALAPHKTFPGNRPTTLIGLERLDPYSLGALLAFYEHRTVVQAGLEGINPFDQWGVELGKQLATGLVTALDGAPLTRPTDPSTAAWLALLGAQG